MSLGSIPVVNDHMGACPRQCIGSREANATGRTGNKRDPPFKIGCHINQAAAGRA